MHLVLSRCGTGRRSRVGVVSFTRLHVTARLWRFSLGLVFLPLGSYVRLRVTINGSSLGRDLLRLLLSQSILKLFVVFYHSLQ